MKVAKGKTGSADVDEEKIYTDKGQALKEVPEAKLRIFINNPATSADVKAGLTSALELAAKVAATAKQLADVEKHLDELSKDQTRLRENLRIIPASSEHYKKFLDKFVGQETRIEGLQTQVHELRASLQTQERAYEVFVTTLSAE